MAPPFNTRSQLASTLKGGQHKLVYGFNVAQGAQVKTEDSGTDMTAQDDFPVRRNWERLEYRTDMVLVLDDGRTIEGKTADVSLGGVFLQTTDPVTDIKMGDRGELRLAPDDVESVFPCQVVRVAEYGLGLNFQGHQATFGMFVTHGMMLDLLTRIALGKFDRAACSVWGER